jgi:hypothetical protein
MAKIRTMQIRDMTLLILGDLLVYALTRGAGGSVARTHSMLYAAARALSSTNFIHSFSSSNYGAQLV